MHEPYASSTDRVSIWHPDHAAPPESDGWRVGRGSASDPLLDDLLVHVATGSYSSGNYRGDHNDSADGLFWAVLLNVAFDVVAVRVLCSRLMLVEFAEHDVDGLTPLLAMLAPRFPREVASLFPDVLSARGLIACGDDIAFESAVQVFTEARVRGDMKSIHDARDATEWAQASAATEAQFVLQFLGRRGHREARTTLAAWLAAKPAPMLAELFECSIRQIDDTARIGGGRFATGGFWGT